MTSYKKVLIVEDNELNLKLFTDPLETLKVKTIQSKDGRLVKEICLNDPPNLVIMDIQLPNISGIDIIQSLKADHKLKDIPIIAVTAFAMQDDRENILNAGCEEYLSKPISIGVFLDTVKKYI
ncbi:MAG TPA: two-component system response regulator [Alphaproteobacteria bacterium]|nr:two-component system response regulator [Alphaproteobacteria bacterium]